MSRQPITDKIKGLRQRQRSDGSWRVWWEPAADARAAGAQAVDLDAARPAWSIREAKRLNDGPRPKRVAPGGRTIAALVDAYKRDPEFTERRPKTQASYNQLLNVITAKWGAARVVDFTKPVMRQWYLTERDARGLTMGNRLLSMMSILFSYAELKGWRAEDSNPCFRLKKKTAAPRDRVATWHEVDCLVAAADALGWPEIGTGILLSLLQGQRWTDVFQARRDNFLQIEHPVGSGKTVWAWQLVRSKRDTKGAMPVHPLVLPRLLPLLISAESDRIVLCNTATGQRYSEDTFQRRFGAVRQAAADAAPDLLGSATLQFRDLRRTFSIWSRAAGASKSDVGDVLGNTAGQNPQLQNTYMPAEFEAASRVVLAIQRPGNEGKRRA